MHPNWNRLNPPAYLKTRDEQIAEIEAAHARRRARGKPPSKAGVGRLERLRAQLASERSPPVVVRGEPQGRAALDAAYARVADGANVVIAGHPVAAAERVVVLSGRRSSMSTMLAVSALLACMPTRGR
jgi:hypothetical protein